MATSRGPRSKARAKSASKRKRSKTLDRDAVEMAAAPLSAAQMRPLELAAAGPATADQDHPDYIDGIYSDDADEERSFTPVPDGPLPVPLPMPFPRPQPGPPLEPRPLPLPPILPRPPIGPLRYCGP